MSWAAFPGEISLLIFGYLDREDWRHLRLTNKANSHLVTPKLFRTLDLTPNTRSFDRARAVAKSPKLSALVQYLVYHIEALVIYRDLYAFQHDILSLSDSSGRQKRHIVSLPWTHKGDISSQHQSYLEELEGEKDFQDRDEEKELTELCQHFTALQSIITITEDDSCFYTSRCHTPERRGLESGTVADGLHFANLFSAVRTYPLTMICALSLSWRDLSKISRRALGQANLQNLERLYICVSNGEFLGSEQPPADVGDLDALLGACVTSNDFTLQLNFGSLREAKPKEELHSIARTIFKYRWPKLTTLALRGIFAMDGELQDFLGRHRTTLTSLNLCDIETPDPDLSRAETEADFGSLTASVVGLFRWIRQNLRLDSASISGKWTNDYDEGWSAQDCEDHSCIRRSIELWLSHKVPSPVPSDLRHTTNHLGLNENIAEQWTDKSWTYFDPLP